MKKMMLILVGILSVNQVMAEPVYRPYLSCISTNHQTNIEMKQNTDAKDISNPFSISTVRAIRGNKISMMNQNAIKIPVHRKDVLELFQSFGNTPAYAFNLLIYNYSRVNMTGLFKAHYMDMLGSSVVYCSYHITFGN